MKIDYEATPEEHDRLKFTPDNYQIWNFRIFHNFGYPIKDFMQMQECLDGKAAGLASVSAFSDSNYQRMLAGEAGARDQIGYARIITQAYPVLDGLNKAGRLKADYAGPITENMTLYLTSINEALASAMYKVVMGEDVSVYEKAVNTWYASGGQDITDEVNAFYAANAK